MTVIDEKDVKSKDFSIVFPRIIQKIEAVAQALINLTDDESIQFNIFALNGFGEILDDATNDLAKMNRALYPSDLKHLHK